MRRASALVFAFGLTLLAGGAAAKETSGAIETAPLDDAVPFAIEAAFERRHLVLGSPVFLRIYKESSSLELWVRQGPRYVLLKAYPICRWSGQLGPKFAEGDLQSPEGYYHITSLGLITSLRWHRAMRLNYPNAFDQVNERDGSGIFIHGGCGSVGCFAMTDANIEEIYGAVAAALKGGQLRVPVLSLPFPLTAKALHEHADSNFDPFWRELAHAEARFEQDRVPPEAWLCGTRYAFPSRRGDAHRHAIHLSGCQTLDEPPSPALVAAARAKRNNLVLAAAAGLTPKERAEEAARNCNPRTVRCRMLRVALQSEVPCPRKYPRCRSPETLYTKSVECPLKYPRCRFFVGPEPRHSAAAHPAHAALRGKRSRH